MQRTFWALVVCAGSIWFGSVAHADGDPTGKACTYKANVQAICAPIGCVVEGSGDFEPTVGAEGLCGKCVTADDCGGNACRADGTCSFQEAAEDPVPVWPHFSLINTAIALDIVTHDGVDVKPVVGTGYYFQGAFRSSNPVKENGIWGYPDVPQLFWYTGLQVAFAGESQVGALDAGITYYKADLPLSITNLSIGALLDRRGASIWNIGNTSENGWRLGPAVRVGFLYNLFLRVGYVWPTAGEVAKDRALLVSIEYMQDLLNDVVPDRYRKYLPEKLK
jgi:hypothetical protein